MNQLWQELRYGARMLAKRPGFAAAAVMTLALGIGANTAIFSVVNAVLLRPLPFPEPERLMTLRSNESLPDLEDISAQGRSFEAYGGATMQALAFTGEAEPLQVQAGLVNADFFKALGVSAEVGRTLAPEEDRYGGERVVVLSHGFWLRHFGGDRGVVGRRIPLSGEGYTVVGVMPPQFNTIGEDLDIWAALRVVNPLAAQFRGVHFLRTYLRLKPGATIEQARAELANIDRRLEQQYPEENKGRHRQLLSLHERVVGDARPALLILFGAVGLVLLVACANFSSLLLARAATRQQEIAIRTALAATRCDVNAVLKEGGRGASGGASRQRVRRLLVVAEMALAVILLVGAGLLIKGFWRLRLVAPGFDPEHVLTMRIELPEAHYKEIPQQTRFRRDLLERLNSLPSVEAAMVSELPLSGDYLTHNFAIEGRAVAPGDEPEVHVRSVGGDYFHTLKIPVLRGRDLTAQDKEDTPIVGVVNESFVRRYFPDANPLGARIMWARQQPPPWITIVRSGG